MDALIAILPFALLFLLCPLMMLFMHRGHDDRVDDREELLRMRSTGGPAPGTGGDSGSRTSHH